VSDYTSQVATGLAAHGDEVHVWCPDGRADNATQLAAECVALHRECGAFSSADLRRVGGLLDRFPAPRRILVQWVPHGYGYRSMNLAFCWWLWRRARAGDRIELMVHEAFLEFSAASPRQNLPALVHRLMSVLLLHSTEQVWMSVPAWEKLLRPYALGRDIAFRWLPIPSNVPACGDPAGVEAVRRQYVRGNHLLIGHFGTYGIPVAKLLEPILRSLPDRHSEMIILLIGKGSEQFRREFIVRHPGLESLVRATGALDSAELASHVAACDLLIQPYPDGVSSRRTSFMAGLSYGKPIVTTTGWLTEPLWYGCNAVALAPAGDTPGFVEQVGRLQEDAAERLRLGVAAARLYQDRFDLSHTIASLRQVESAGEHACAFS
jgi:glycosyltransferase involved in cell wall biosynthesis